MGDSTPTEARMKVRTKGAYLLERSPKKDNPNPLERSHMEDNPNPLERTTSLDPLIRNPHL